jgi:formate/nitrite transporter FocA (FNT family)
LARNSGPITIETENFLIPVIAVLRGERSLRSLFELFVFSWLGNLIGSAITAALLFVPNAIGEPILVGYQAYAAYKPGLPLPGLFVSAVLAGLVMTAFTWVLLAIHNTVADIFAIFSAGYVLFGANLSHSIIGASLLIVGFAVAGKTLLDVLAWIAIATIGNTVGSVGLVTLFRFALAREQGKQA